MSGEGGHIEPAIALSTIRHKDGVAILKLFTREQGIIGCVVREGIKGARRAKHLHAPLSMLHLLGLRALKGDLHRFDRSERPLPQERTLLEVPRSAVAMFLAEVILRTVEPDAPHPALFDALWRTAEALETEDIFTRLHLSFLVEAVRVQGLQPDAPVVPPPRHGPLQPRERGMGIGSADWGRFPFSIRRDRVSSHSRHGN